MYSSYCGPTYCITAAARVRRTAINDVVVIQHLVLGVYMKGSSEFL